jgi:hypothetical protein
VGWARLNEGSGLENDVQPFPRLSRSGFALEFEWTYEILEVLGFLLTKSWTTYLEEVNFEGDPEEENGWGLELTLADVFTYRIGEVSYSEEDFYINKKTSGFTVQTRGITNALYLWNLRQDCPEGSLLHYLLTRVNFAYHTTRWAADEDIIDGTDWFELSLTF